MPNMNTLVVVAQSNIWWRNAFTHYSVLVLCRCQELKKFTYNEWHKSYNNSHHHRSGLAHINQTFLQVHNVKYYTGNPLLSQDTCIKGCGQTNLQGIGDILHPHPPNQDTFSDRRHWNSRAEELANAISGQKLLSLAILISSCPVSICHEPGC